MAVHVIPPQPSSPHNAQTPIPYTGSPILLCLSDLRLFLSLAWSIPGVLTPIKTQSWGPLDELYPSLPNLFALGLHGFLLVFQLFLLLSLPVLMILPLWLVFLYTAIVYVVTWVVASLLNGNKNVLHSAVDLQGEEASHEGECWVYLNGVSIGKHWLQTNLDRLAYTFRRPIIGVHNRTYGILFDLLQCIIERDFCYATADIRRSYVTVKEKMLDPSNKKVVLILHSQGGIEGGLIVDWLLTELPHDVVGKLEIYTFGSAANHFNNPPRHAVSGTSPSANGDDSTYSPTLANEHHNAIRHIEHYASAGEFVARWGVLYFAPLPNRYAGRVFVRPGTGHLLNQHYLSSMFPLDENMRVMEHNAFMDMEVKYTNSNARDDSREGYVEMLPGTGGAVDDAVVEDVELGMREMEGTVIVPRVREYSRLWLYRNGGSPKD